MTFKATGLHELPVELLYEVQLYSLSESLPLASRHLFDVFKHASPYFNAQYIQGRAMQGPDVDISEIYTRALRYPICDQAVLSVIVKLLVDRKGAGQRTLIQLPRRLFRSLSPPHSGWTKDDEPIPFLQYLFSNPEIPSINTNCHEGYALTKAVHARFISLVELLLDNRASPKTHDRLAVKVAVRQKSLAMLKLLVERRQTRPRQDKKRKLEDRVTLDAEILKIAVKSGAKDIVDYLCKEKNVVPDFETLKRL